VTHLSNSQANTRQQGDTHAPHQTRG
jgi:hypothetical protein